MTQCVQTTKLRRKENANRNIEICFGLGLVQFLRILLLLWNTKSITTTLNMVECKLYTQADVDSYEKNFPFLYDWFLNLTVAKETQGPLDFFDILRQDSARHLSRLEAKKTSPERRPRRSMRSTSTSSLETSFVVSSFQWGITGHSSRGILFGTESQKGTSPSYDLYLSQFQIPSSVYPVLDRPVCISSFDDINVGKRIRHPGCVSQIEQCKQNWNLIGTTTPNSSVVNLWNFYSQSNNSSHNLSDCSPDLRYTFVRFHSFLFV